MAGKPQAQAISELKEQALEYYKQVPIKKYAAAHVGRNEDTFLVWEKQDSEFSDRVTRARAEFVQRKLNKIRDNKWTLERLFKQDFGQSMDVTSGGEKIQPILGGQANVHGNDGN